MTKRQKCVNTIAATCIKVDMLPDENNDTLCTVLFFVFRGFFCFGFFFAIASATSTTNSAAGADNNAFNAPREAAGLLWWCQWC